MAKKPKPSMKSGRRTVKPSGPPMLLLAVFCEKAIKEEDRVYTVIRVVDSLKVTAPERPPKGMGIALPITTLVAFKANGFRGKLPLEFVQISPTGLREKVGANQVEFIGGITSAYIHGALTGVKYDKDGVYEFEVRLGGRLYTKMPLQLAFDIVETAIPPLQVPLANQPGPA